MGKFLGTYMQTCIIKILGNNFQQQLQHPITKKADAEPKKSRSNKKSRCRTSLLKNGPTKLPCLLIILASWVDFFDIGLLLYPVPHHTLQCYTRKSFWVTRTGESKLFCIGFSLFWGRCRTWCRLCFLWIFFWIWTWISIFQTFANLQMHGGNAVINIFKWFHIWPPPLLSFCLHNMGGEWTLNIGSIVHVKMLAHSYPVLTFTHL